MDLHSTKPAAGWFDRLIDVLAVVAGALICLLVVLICVDVFARNTGTINMPWSLEVAQYSMLVVTFFGAPWVLREQGHIVVDLLLQGLEPARRAKVDRIGHVVCAIVCAVLTYFATLVWWRSYQSGIKIHDTFVFPEWVLMSVAPPTFLILMAQFVRWVAHPPARGASGVEDGL